MLDYAFTTKQLADLGIPGAPVTAEGWRSLAKNGAWTCLEQPGRGRGGIKCSYIPPQPMLALILRHMNGEVVTADAFRTARSRCAPLPVASGARSALEIHEPNPTGYPVERRFACSQLRKEVTLRLGLLTHETSWLPRDLDVDCRSALALRACAALEAAANHDEEAFSTLSLRPSALDLALRLGWEALGATDEPGA